MSDYEKRLAKLEKEYEATAGGDDPILIIRFIVMAKDGKGPDVPVNAYRAFGWGEGPVLIRRNEGESHEAFDARAADEALALHRPGDPYRVVLYPEEMRRDPEGSNAERR